MSLKTKRRDWEEMGEGGVEGEGMEGEINQDTLVIYEILNNKLKVQEKIQALEFKNNFYHLTVHHKHT